MFMIGRRREISRSGFSNQWLNLWGFRGIYSQATVTKADWSGGIVPSN